jgi:iron complex outermembrane receptor protein
MISKMPTAAPLHELQFTTGSYGLVQGAFALGGTAHRGWVGAVSSQWYRPYHTETQVDHTLQQRLALAPAITGRLDNDTRLTILLSALHDPNAGFYNQLPLSGTVITNPNGRIPTSFYQGSPDFDQFRCDQVTAGYILERRIDDGSRSTRACATCIRTSTIAAPISSAPRRTCAPSTAISSSIASS